MKLATYTPCDEPSKAMQSGMVQLCELVTCDEDDLGPVVNIYVHPGLRLAFSLRDGKQWSVAHLDHL